jgi:hypothetical protein
MYTTFPVAVGADLAYTASEAIAGEVMVIASTIPTTPPISFDFICFLLAAATII